MRLVGVLQPVRANDIPRDSFESTALRAQCKVRTSPMYRESGSIAGLRRSTTSTKLSQREYGTADPIKSAAAESDAERD
jgi:hypothetical protein